MKDELPEQLLKNWFDIWFITIFEELKAKMGFYRNKCSYLY